MLALAPPDCAEVEDGLAAALDAELEDAGLVAELLGAAATFATAPLADAGPVELEPEDVDVEVGRIVLHETPPVPVTPTTDGRAMTVQ